jgi:hypothetical protein
MSRTKEQSAIDAIYEILEKIEFLDKRVQIIDDNLKILSNKVTKLSRNVAASAAVTTVGGNTTRDEPKKQQEIDRLVLGNIKTYGYIVNRTKKPIENVNINIYDVKNKLIKNAKTNNDGYWEVRLPPGKYGVEYIHKNFKPINRVAELVDDIRDYEVR